MFTTASRKFKYNTIPRVGFTTSLVRKVLGQSNPDHFEVQYPPAGKPMLEIGQKKKKDERHGFTTRM